jgi:hypothetical protein
MAAPAPEDQRRASVTEDEFRRMPRASVSSFYEMGDVPASPPRRSSVPEDVHADVVDASIKRAYEVEKALGPSYVHKSQVSCTMWY